MPFKKGQGKVGGRKPGTRNKQTLELSKLCKLLTLENPKFIEQLKNKINAGTLETPILLRLIDYGYGTPTKRLEVSGADGGPVEYVSPDFGTAPSQKTRGNGNGHDVTLGGSDDDASRSSSRPKRH